MEALAPHQEQLLRTAVVPLLLAPPAKGSDPLDLRLLADWFVRPELTRELVKLLAGELELTTGFTVRRASAQLFARRVHPGALYLAVLPARTAEQHGIGAGDTVRQAIPGVLLRIVLTYGGILQSEPAG